MEPAYAESSAGAASAKMQKLTVTVGDKETLSNEMKFWIDACLMKVLSESADADGNRMVFLGYGAVGESFGIELKVDPGVLKRRGPRMLNYDVMQPTVNAVNYLQLSLKDKVMDIFRRVEASGGSSLIGDLTYIDVESPRGVPLRLVSRDSSPNVDLVSLNIEVPAFEATTKFYQRAFGYKDLEYPATEPAVQPLSQFYSSSAGGPNLLLCPVPDGRLKERSVDATESITMVAPDAIAVSTQVESAIQLAKEELETKEEEEQKKREKAIAEGKSPKDTSKETKARPTFKRLDDKVARIDDGLGNLYLLEAV